MAPRRRKGVLTAATASAIGRRFMRGAVLATWVGGTLITAPAAARAQAFSGFERERVRMMLRQVRDEIERRYYDSTFHGTDLAAQFATSDARIQQAASLDDALLAVAQLPLALHDSHTLFAPPQRTVRVNYGWEMAMVGDSCYVTRVKKGSDAARQGVAVGDLVVSVNGYQPTRQTLWQLLYLFYLLRPQSGLRVVLQSPGGLPRQLDVAAEVREGKSILDLTGGDDGEDIAQLLRNAQNEERDLRGYFLELGDDVLVWKFPTFFVDDGVIKDLMKRARARKTLILDVRGNSGGPVRTLLALLGRFSRNADTLGTQRERRHTVPLVAKGTGDDAFTGQLLILVDSRSASSSEMLARAVQLAKRGTVLGDRTAGAVMIGIYQPLAIGTQTVVAYGVNVTDADLVMSDGSRLEGIGVSPDTLVVPSGADLAAGRDPAFARALALTGRRFDPAAAGALLRPVLPPDHR